MVPAIQLQALTDTVLFEDNVNLAVLFGSTRPDDAARLSLLLDCDRGDVPTMVRFGKALSNRLNRRIDIFRLADARPAALLMRQVLNEGTMLKDYLGQWDELRAEHDQIVSEAEAHERWEAALKSGLAERLAADDSVTLAVEFAPIGLQARRVQAPDANLLLGCAREDEGSLLAAHARLQETGFRVEVMPLRSALEFPFALSHIVRTGKCLKDSEGRWASLQGEREKIIKAGRRQLATVRLARSLYGGRGGSASLN